MTEIAISVTSLVRWLESAPANLAIVAGHLAEILGGLRSENAPAAPPGPSAPATQPTWPERLCSAPAEMRMGAVELAAALGRPRSWVYRHTSRKSGLPVIPHRKLDGQLVFLVGEVRQWLREHEEVAAHGRPESSAVARPQLRLRA